MKIKDNIYGEFSINEPVIAELLKSPALIRLKKISQYGVPDKYYHFKNFSRYEHSIGVMILLGKLGVTLEERVAGLIHDVSHFAFSHVADWVFSEGDKGNEDLHDSITKEFVKKSQIGDILSKHHLSVDRLLDEENYPLLEKKIPDLCADRVDYALREFMYWFKPEIVEKCLSGLVNYNGEIAFTSEETALDFASGFLELQTKHWGGYESMMRYHLFSSALKLALKEEIIKKNDFFMDELHILKKIEGSDNKKIKEILKTLKNKKIAKNGSLGKKIYKKFRHVDPKVVIDGKAVKLSSLSRDFSNLLIKQRIICMEGLCV